MVTTANQEHYKMHISKKNEVYIILSELTDSERQELSEFFTFEVPGAKFMPQFKKSYVGW